MKILWLCNIILPEVMEQIGKKSVPVGGWLSGMLEGITKSYTLDCIDITVCMPCGWLDVVEMSKTDRYQYCLFPCHRNDQYYYNDRIEGYFNDVLGKVQPDLVHIWGTEFPTTLSMVNACEKLGLLDRVVINIQGLVSIIAKHYYTQLPWYVIYDFMTPRHLVFHDPIVQQKKAFEKRGEYEVEALRKVKHVIGRTDWDKACVTQINPDINYHCCNEILRKSFYKHEWNLEKCERYSIFISQATYPIKGLHIALEAMPLIIKQYPLAHLYVAGPDVTHAHDSYKNKLKLTSYGKYIKKLISKYDLDSYITFCGSLNEEQMCQLYLKSNMFLSPSLVENESNSVSEAKILGMPVVASYVGGVISRISHGHDGLLYPCDAPYMLAYYIKNIFNDTSYAVVLGNNARKQARKVNDRKENTAKMLAIYKNIIEE